MEGYPFSAKFYSRASVITPNDKDVFMAKASLESLKGLLPPDINPHDSPDFLYVAADAAQAGRANLNSDAIDVETSLRIYSQKYKYLGVDHTKNIVGVLLYPGLSEYGTSKLIDEAKARELGVFNFCLVGIVWRAIDKELVDTIIESSDPASPNFGRCNFSWEIFFKSYNIGVGSGLIKEDRVYKEGGEDYDKYYDMLLCNGGKGKDGKDKVYRIISGPDTIIAGYSFVVNPAADVKGVAIFTDKQPPMEIEKDEKDGKKDSDKVIAINNKQVSFSTTLAPEHIEQLKTYPLNDLGILNVDIETHDGNVYENVPVYNHTKVSDDFNTQEIRKITVRKQAKGEVLPDRFVQELKKHSLTNNEQICEIKMKSGVVLDHVTIQNYSTLPENIPADDIESVKVKDFAAKAIIIDDWSPETDIPFRKIEEILGFY